MQMQKQIPFGDDKPERQRQMQKQLQLQIPFGMTNEKNDGKCNN